MAHGRSKKPAGGRSRTCAVCRRQDEPENMIRWVRGDDGQVFPDLASRAFGRGAWTHFRPECLAKIQPGLARSFKAPVATSSEEAQALLAQAGAHWVGQLLGTARRQGRLAAGATPTIEAIEAENAHLVLVAHDARAAASLGPVQALVPQGLVRAWGTKDALGRLCGRPEIGVLAVLDQRLAQRLFGAIAMALLAPDLPDAKNLAPRELEGLDGGSIE